MSRYEWYRDEAGSYRWRLKSRNGLVLASGEGYTRKQDVLRGITTHRKASATERVVEVRA